MVAANFGIALEAIWANRLRSLLTALGILIGVAAVIAALTLTQGASASINARFSRFGPSTITVRNGTASSRGVFGAGGTVQSLTPADAQAIQQQVPNVAYVSPVVSASEQLVFGSENESTTVQGVSPDYQTIQDWTLSEGLWFSATDQASGKTVAVIGQTVVQNLFAPDTTDDVNQVQQGITTLLEQHHHILKGQTDDFNTESSAELMQTANQLTSTLTLLLVGIASISLTVGGIGIMNIMIVSVTERTREIGIRMAVGARRKDVRNQFLIEALTLSLVGGILGMLLGIGVGYIVTNSTGLPFVFSLTSLLMPFAISATIGVAFGLYPAIRASQLDPIEALHSE
jgi:putative ABC transport system permease protein